jgi:formylglycine-generating enzyme required for sulfatase activity
MKAPASFVVVAISAFSLSALAAAAKSVPAPGTIIQDCPNCPQLVVIPPGRFKMGSLEGAPDRPETPIRDIGIGYSFAAGKTPVTNGQFARFIETSHYRPAKGCGFLNGAGYKFSPDQDWRDPGYGRPPRDDEPVVCVSWLDAKAYAAWLSKITRHRYRLLSETEWEYAARAGAATRYPWGDAADDICRYANLYDRSAAGLNMAYPPAPCDDGFPEVAPVGSFPPNKFGLYDMLGNVWQWVEDCYLFLYPAWPADGKPVEVKSACPQRSARGGSWATMADRLRPSWRGRDTETTTNRIFGFRIARDL